MFAYYRCSVCCCIGVVTDVEPTFAVGIDDVDVAAATADVVVIVVNDVADGVVNSYDI